MPIRKSSTERRRGVGSGGRRRRGRRGPTAGAPRPHHHPPPSGHVHGFLPLIKRGRTSVGSAVLGMPARAVFRPPYSAAAGTEADELTECVARAADLGLRSSSCPCRPGQLTAATSIKASRFTGATVQLRPPDDLLTCALDQPPALLVALNLPTRATSVRSASVAPHSSSHGVLIPATPFCTSVTAVAASASAGAAAQVGDGPGRNLTRIREVPGRSCVECR